MTRIEIVKQEIEKCLSNIKVHQAAKDSGSTMMPADEWIAFEQNLLEHAIAKLKKLENLCS